MEKPAWRLRASRYIVDSPYMRLREDEVELPNGTVVSNYYVRESRGFVIIVALTADERVVLVRQYRYGSDSIHLEIPAGMLLEGEDPAACALRELAEETGYAVEHCERAGEFFAEAVRSNARAFIYIGRAARKVAEPVARPNRASRGGARTPADLSPDARGRANRHGSVDRCGLSGAGTARKTLSAETWRVRHGTKDSDEKRNTRHESDARVLP